MTDLLDLARDRANSFLNELPDRHVGPRATRDELVAALKVPLSDDGEDPAAVSMPVPVISASLPCGLIVSERR